MVKVRASLLKARSVVTSGSLPVYPCKAVQDHMFDRIPGKPRSQAFCKFASEVHSLGGQADEWYAILACKTAAYLKDLRDGVRMLVGMTIMNLHNFQKLHV